MWGNFCGPWSVMQHKAKVSKWPRAPFSHFLLLPDPVCHICTCCFNRCPLILNRIWVPEGGHFQWLPTASITKQPLSSGNCYICSSNTILNTGMYAFLRKVSWTNSYVTHAYNSLIIRLIHPFHIPHSICLSLPYFTDPLSKWLVKSYMYQWQWFNHSTDSVSCIGSQIEAPFARWDVTICSERWKSFEMAEGKDVHELGKHRKANIMWVMPKIDDKLYTSLLWASEKLKSTCLFEVVLPISTQIYRQSGLQAQ